MCVVCLRKKLQAVYFGQLGLSQPFIKLLHKAVTSGHDEASFSQADRSQLGEKWNHILTQLREATNEAQACGVDLSDVAKATADIEDLVASALENRYPSGSMGYCVGRLRNGIKNVLMHT